MLKLNSQYLFLFQVNLYIWRFESPHLYLSLFQPQVKSSLRNVGKIYSGIVESVHEYGINIQLENSPKKGFVPNAHLSCSLSLCQAIKSKCNHSRFYPLVDLCSMAGNNLYFSIFLNSLIMDLPNFLGMYS